MLREAKRVDNTLGAAFCQLVEQLFQFMKKGKMIEVV